MSALCDISLEQADAFCDYFNMADELSAPLTQISDLSGRLQRGARLAADAFQLAWPPRLAEAEEFWLSNRSCLQQALRDLGRIS